MKKVFVDGGAGTTGLNIVKRLSMRKDITLITLSEEKRKDEEARKDAIFESDVTFLCLPDAAAVTAAKLAKGSGATIIDTSTAHRVSPDFVYGFAELDDSREKIASAKLIANPGCHASGFIALAYPLVKAGAISREAALSCFSLTGYSGGGKKMIAEYESAQKAEKLLAPGMYGLSQTHKHLPEMKAVCGLENAPVFCPVVADYYSGMMTVITLCGGQTPFGIKEIKDVYRTFYRGGVVKYAEDPDDNGFLYAGGFSGRDDMEISVYGGEERVILVARFDNLGKGACGAAIQNMNINLGLPEETGLILSEA